MWQGGQSPVQDTGKSTYSIALELQNFRTTKGGGYCLNGPQIQTSPFVLPVVVELAHEKLETLT
jgi:hypothetical protein